MMDSRWKQAKPIDQYIVIVMALEGTLDNMNHDVISLGQYFHQTQDLILQLVNLVPYVEKGSWIV